MATELDLPKALAELFTQLSNLRRLITIGGEQYKYDAKSNSYKGEGGKSFSVSQLKGKARAAFQTVKTAVKGNTAKRLKIKNQKTFSRAPKKNLVQTPSPTWGVDQNKTKTTPKTTPKKTKTKKTKGVKQKTQYKTTGKPPIEIKPKKIFKAGKKILKKIRNIPGAGTFGKGVARVAGLAGGGAQLYGLGENLVDHAREVTNVVQRIRNKPFKTFGATGYEKKLIEKSEERRKNKNTNNKVKINKKDKNTNTDKKETAYDKLRSGKPTGLANLPENEGRVVVKGRGGKATRVNPDYGVKGQPDKVVNENKRTSKIKSKKKSGSKYPDKIGGKKTSSIQKKLIDGGWTKERLEEKMRQHKDWKAARGRR